MFSKCLTEILMLIHVPDHFSSKLNFDLRKTPANVADRSSLLWSILGCFFSFALLLLGMFELFSFFKAEKSSSQSFLVLELFALIIILIGLGLLVYSIFSFIRYKKFTFDGKEFHIVYRPAIGIKHRFREPLANYIGVRLRVLFVQSGLFNKNRYIIDLYHQDSSKIVPLYISTSNRNIRQIWEGYAKFFNMPTLSVSDRGLVQRECADLDTSLRDLGRAGKLPFIASGKLPSPKSLEITEKRDSTVVDIKGLYWDTFSILNLFVAAAAVLLFTAGGVYLTIIGSSFPIKYWIICGCVLLLTLYFTLRLFYSYSLSIGNHEVFVHRSFLGTIVNSQKLDIDVIENVELSYNPTIGRYSLTFISDDKTMDFCSRLPVSDLIWLRDFVVRKLIGN